MLLNILFMVWFGIMFYNVIYHIKTRGKNL
jgi:cbb3-type cytochrome oxidase subunit 3